MRFLEFQVREQVLMKKPGCDFSNIVAGSSGYLRAKFYFTEDWNEYVKKAAHFIGEDGSEEAVILDENNECEIPSKVLTGKYFIVTTYGAGDIQKCGDNMDLPVVSTSSMKVKQVVK